MPPQETHVVQNLELSLLYERFAGALLASLCQQVTHRQDAEDLLLEVFLAALEYPALTALPADRQLAWLRRVARNKVIDHYRHASVFTIQPLDQTPASEDQRLTPERHAEAQETWSWLVQAIGQLPADQRELLRLRYGQELRLTQIATLLEKPEGSVRKMLSRILRRLRTRYEQEERSDPHA
jgi:RNA polymerase sigma-70 factor (ECF subfamily)